MIVSMKKITLLISAAEQDKALLRLRDLGVVHVDSVKTPSSDELASIETRLANIEKSLQLIGNPLPGNSGATPGDAPKIVDRIIECSRKKEFLLRELAEYQKQNRWFDEWGAVSLESLGMLREAGVDVRFHITTKKALKELPPGEPVRIIGWKESRVYLIHLAAPETPRLDLTEDPMPAVEIGPMRERMAEIESSVNAIDAEIGKMAVHADELHACRKQVLSNQEFARAKYGMGEAEAVVYLRGFCPYDVLEPIKKAADTEGWAYVIQDPDDPQEVPTLIRTPGWVRMIRPVFDFMGTVPGYSEFDISFWFLLFFSLFYAMLVGDGGYGLIFLALTLFARTKFKKIPREVFGLLFVLSGTTIVWGAITGTWFGMSGIFDVPAFAFLKKLVIRPLSSIDGDQDFVMKLCFTIGAVHLTIAHALNARRTIRTPNTLSQFGWIAIIWSLFFVAGKLVLSNAVPGFTLPLLLTGLALVLLFENYQRRAILKGALITLANLPLSAISAFSDIVSYLRLFAVGFASYIVAVSFNDMAGDIAGGAFGTLIAALILFVGHTINIVLALMAVVVHGIRLNMLEFSGHLNMQWSGKPYLPFKSTGEIKS